MCCSPWGGKESDGLGDRTELSLLVLLALLCLLAHPKPSKSLLTLLQGNIFQTASVTWQPCFKTFCDFPISVE